MTRLDSGSATRTRDAVGDGWTVPLHATPLSAKFAGTGLPLVHEPLNPKLALPLVARLPFQPTLRAVTCAPLCETVAFQACVICWPAPNDQVSVQLVTGSPRLVRLTLAPKPPGHWELTE